MDATKHVVLVGGGHAHVLVLRAFARHPEPGLRLSLVAPALETPYSGMLPGEVAGLYSREEMHIDLAALSAAAGARLVRDEAVGFDRAGKQVLLGQEAPLAYDILSIDIGVTPDLSGIEGAKEHALAVKPIGVFLDKWEQLRVRALAPDGPRRIAVVGGGLAGICLVFAVAARLRREAREQGLDAEAFVFALVSAEAPSELNACVRGAVRRALAERRIAFLADERALAVEPGALVLSSGRRIAADVVLMSTQAAAPPALTASGFARCAQGFLAVRLTLQVENDPDVFAAGDCAGVIDHPRPKAGVYAVRQGPLLAENLRRRARGESLHEQVPQKRHLVLIGLGDGRAIGGRGRWIKVEGRWVWRLKDFIDRRFMRQFAGISARRPGRGSGE